MAPPLGCPPGAARRNSAHAKFLHPISAVTRMKAAILSSPNPFRNVRCRSLKLQILGSTRTCSSARSCLRCLPHRPPHRRRGIAASTREHDSRPSNRRRSCRRGHRRDPAGLARGRVLARWNRWHMRILPTRHGKSLRLAHLYWIQRSRRICAICPGARMTSCIRCPRRSTISTRLLCFVPESSASAACALPGLSRGTRGLVRLRCFCSSRNRGSARVEVRGVCVDARRVSP